MPLALTRRELLSVFAGAPLIFGQDQAGFSVDVKVVNVLATVRDKKGQIVRDLSKNDFQLEEDGKAQEIKYFSRETDLPLTLGLLIDTSGSQRNLIEAERRASHKFFQNVLREDKDMAFVIHFDQEAELLQDLTGSRRELEKSLDELKAPDGPQLQRRVPGQRPGGGAGGGQRRRTGAAK